MKSSIASIQNNSIKIETRGRIVVHILNVLNVARVIQKKVHLKIRILWLKILQK